MYKIQENTNILQKRLIVRPFFMMSCYTSCCYSNKHQSKWCEVSICACFMSMSLAGAYFIGDFQPTLYKKVYILVKKKIRKYPYIICSHARSKTNLACFEEFIYSHEKSSGEDNKIIRDGFNRASQLHWIDYLRPFFWFVTLLHRKTKSDRTVLNFVQKVLQLRSIVFIYMERK